jgi:hypothetical protein
VANNENIQQSILKITYFLFCSLPFSRNSKKDTKIFYAFRGSNLYEDRFLGKGNVIYSAAV